MLRVALSDDAGSPRYVELIRGRGYRLVADVEPQVDTSPRGGSRRWLGVLAVAAAVLVLLWITAITRDGDRRPSVAVLPFADMSQLGDQKYLADGVAEEIINYLAELDGLDVASRTESFAVAGTADSLQEAGEQLRVTAVLEGSIRKSGKEIRVTVQLIDVDSGYHLWSESFDSNLDDFFAVQEYIASSVAGALGVTLGVGGVNEFRGAGTQNFDAYEAYLRGDFEKAIQLDPDYAAAWGRQGVRIASTMWRNLPEEAPEILERAYAHVARAIELNPGSAWAQADFATMIYATMDWEGAQMAFISSLSHRRTTTSLRGYANMLMRAGRSREALAHHKEREALLRVAEAPSIMRFYVDIALGDHDLVRRKVAQVDPDLRAHVELLVALNGESLEALRAAIGGMPKNTPAYRNLFGPLLARLESPVAAAKFLEEVADDPNRAWPFRYQMIALLAAYLGYPELALEVFLRELRHTTIRFGTLWFPVMSEVRRLPAFKQFLRDANLVEYWRNHGWADFCRPVGIEDFDCE
jgi:TolB-like protein